MGCHGLPTDTDILADIQSTLREILKWTRFANTSKLKEILEAELDSNEKRLAFEGSDGINGLKEVSEVSGAPRDTVYSWWQKWYRMGLVTDSETRKGRMMRIASLDEVGLKVPNKSS